MKIILSTSQAFLRWMGLSLPRMPGTDEKRLGKQPLVSHEDQLSWQCHFVSQYPKQLHGAVILVEAWSRYCLIIPYMIPPTPAQLEQDICRYWSQSLIELMLENMAISNQNSQNMLQQFADTPFEFEWYKNVDLSVNGHVTDVEQWVWQHMRQYGDLLFQPQQAAQLSLTLNNQIRKARQGQKKAQSFFPAQRMLEDGLFRFARQITESPFALPGSNSYPSPYHRQDKTVKLNEPIPDNVISLDDYRRRK